MQGLLLLSTAEALAQEVSEPAGPSRGDTVSTRPRPELEPQGSRLGSLLVYSYAGLSPQFDNNVYANNANREADFISVFSPTLIARTHGTRHPVGLSAGADLGRYQEFSAENYDDWRVSADGLIDRTPASRVLLGGAYAQLHQPRESPDDRGGLSPTRYSSVTAFADFFHRPGRVFLHPALVVNRLDFQSVTARVAGELVEINQDDRDRNEYTATLEGGLGQGPDDGVFVRARGVLRDYDRSQFGTGFDRSSEGFEAGAGLNLNPGGVTRARAYVGYREQRYPDPLSDIREPVFEVSLSWNPSELTTVGLEARRDLAETIGSVYSGYVATSGRIAVDHELRRNLLLNAAFVYERDAYEGIGRARRSDAIYGVGAGMTWLLNRHVVVSLRYESSGRDSSDDSVPQSSPSDDFDRNMGWVRIVFRR